MLASNYYIIINRFRVKKGRKLKERSNLLPHNQRSWYKPNGRTIARDIAEPHKTLQEAGCIVDPCGFFNSSNNL